MENTPMLRPDVRMTRSFFSPSVSPYSLIS